MTYQSVLSDDDCLCLFDEGGEPVAKPHIEEDEYAFIDTCLQRWRDRDYRHIDKPANPACECTIRTGQKLNRCNIACREK